MYVHDVTIEATGSTLKTGFFCYGVVLRVFHHRLQQPKTLEQKGRIVTVV